MRPALFQGKGPAFTGAAGLLCMVFVLGGFDASGETSAGERTFSPQRVLLVTTTESWGCPSSTAIVSDVTEEVSLADGIPAELAEGVPAEDLVRRPELLIIFPPGAADQLSGSLVLKVHLQSKESPGKGTLLLDKAELMKAGKGYSLDLTGRLDGDMQTRLLYGRNPRLRPTLPVCPDGGFVDPVGGSFFSAYEVAKQIKSSYRFDEEGRQVTRFDINAETLKRARLVDRAEGAALLLEGRFSSSGDYSFHWRAADVTADAVVRTVPDLQAAGLIVSLTGSEELPSFPAVGDPVLRQAVSLVGDDGGITAAELLIGRPGLQPLSP